MDRSGRPGGRQRASGVVARGSLASMAVSLGIVGLAIYVVIRSLFWGFGENELLFLQAVIIGLLGMEAFSVAMRRRSEWSPLHGQLADLSRREEASTALLSDAQKRLTELQLNVSGLRLGAGAGQLLLSEFDVPHDRMRRAQHIQWSGITLRTRLRQRLPDLGVALAHGARLDLLAVDPCSSELKAEIAARENSKPQYVEGVMQSMVLNLQLLSEKVTGTSALTLGFHQNFPTYGLIILDPADDDGLCLVELYNPDLNREVVFVVHATLDAPWFAFFAEQFVIMQSKCRTAHVASPHEVDEFAFGSSSGHPSPGNRSP